MLTSAFKLLRFLDNEKWREEFGVDDLVLNFNYSEKPQVFEYYPQYYHKTDKVWPWHLDTTSLWVLCCPTARSWPASFG